MTIFYQTRGPLPARMQPTRNGAGADPSASGATRIAGTVNYKRKYEPHFPTVRIADAAPGAGLRHRTNWNLSACLPQQNQSMPPVFPLRTSRNRSGARTERTWPDYERCVAGAPPNKEGDGPDRSMADFFWCMMAAQRG